MFSHKTCVHPNRVCNEGLLIHTEDIEYEAPVCWQCCSNVFGRFLMHHVCSGWGCGECNSCNIFENIAKEFSKL